MSKDDERRKERRMRYNWPVWFAEDSEETFSQGEMLDVSSGGMAIICEADEICIHPDRKLIFRFSVPRFSSFESFERISFARVGSILRVDEVSKYVRRVAIKFDKPLSFKPGEQLSNKYDLLKIKDALNAI